MIFEKLYVQICGNYGEYICDATDEDVCGFQCRDLCIQRMEEKKVKEKDLSIQNVAKERNIDSSMFDKLRKELQV